MAKPVWLLLSSLRPDWRWMTGGATRLGIRGSGSSGKRGREDWDALIGAVSLELAALARRRGEISKVSESDPMVDAAVALLELMAVLTASMKGLAQRCRNHPHVSSAVRGTDVCRYAERLSLELFLDVEMKSGESYTYWVEIWWADASWI